MCGRELFKLLRVSTLKFEKVCGREFFGLLRVSTFKFYSKYYSFLIPNFDECVKHSSNG